MKLQACVSIGLPVTALVFISEDLLVAGIGNEVLVFTIVDSLVVQTIKFSERFSIYGFFWETSLLVSYGLRCVSLFNIDISKQLKPLELMSSTCFLPDQILAVKVWTFTNGNKALCLATAHNEILMGELEEVKKGQYFWTRVLCQEKCMLYSACFFVNNKTLFLAGGTVFNQILIWNASLSNKKKRVLHTLEKHNGVIFDMKYCTSTQRLLSVSDDRSVVLWQGQPNMLTSSSASDDDVCDTSDLDSWIWNPLFQLFGHVARVWATIFLSQESQNGAFLTVGEDCSVIEWDNLGNIKSRWQAHTGRGIWSIAVSPNFQLAATGGNDGAIFVRRLAQAHSEKCFDERLLTQELSLESDFLMENDFPRLTFFGPCGHLFVVTNCGRLLAYLRSASDSDFLLKRKSSAEINRDVYTAQPQLTLQFPPYMTSYCVCVPSPSRFQLLLGGLSGYLCQLSYDQASCTYFFLNSCTWQCTGLKVMDIVWLSESTALVSFADGCAALLTKSSLTEFYLTPSRIFRLPITRGLWWVTAACSVCSLTSSILVGDRQGGLHYFEDPAELLLKSDNPLQKTDNFKDTMNLSLVTSYQHAHNKHGITYLLEDSLNAICTSASTKFNHRLTYYSTGKDGKICVWFLDISRPASAKLILMRYIREPAGLTWLERLSVPWHNKTATAEEHMNNEKDILVLGFHAAEFKCARLSLASESASLGEVLVMSVECGGGHRAWDVAMGSFRAHVDTISKRPRRRENEVILFGYIAHRHLFISSLPLNREWLLQPGLHGRTINCIHHVCSVSSSDVASDFVIFGGEDTHTSFALAQSSKNTHLGSRDEQLERSAHTVMDQRRRQTAHISSIRCINSSPWPSQEQSVEYSQRLHIIVTGGGRAQLVGWLAEASRPCDAMFLTTYTIRERDRDEKKATRVMDVRCVLQKSGLCDAWLLVSAACSDGRLVMLELRERSALNCWRFAELGSVQLAAFCVLEARLLRMRDAELLYVCVGTSGEMCFNWVQVDADAPQVHFVAAKQLQMAHCSINSLSIVDNLFMWIGLDDGAVRRLQFESERYADVEHTLVCNCAEHAASVVRVCATTAFKCVSLGADRRLITWLVDCDAQDRAQLRPLFCCLTSVPDPQDMCIFDSARRNQTLAVCGQGLQLLNLYD